MTAERASVIVRCDRTDAAGECPEPAHWRIGLRVWPSRINFPDAEPYLARLSLYVCERHRASVALDDVLGTDHTREKLDAAARQRNGWPGMPDWLTAEVAFFPVEVTP